DRVVDVATVPAGPIDDGLVLGGVDVVDRAAADDGLVLGRVDVALRAVADDRFVLGAVDVIEPRARRLRRRLAGPAGARAPVLAVQREPVLTGARAILTAGLVPGALPAGAWPL